MKYSLREIPPGCIVRDCNNDPIIIWPDGSYARPGRDRIPARINSTSFAPYRIEKNNLTAKQCDAVWHVNGCPFADLPLPCVCS